MKTLQTDLMVYNMVRSVKAKLLAIDMIDMHSPSHSDYFMLRALNGRSTLVGYVLQRVKIIDVVF